jgi:hypothetical protein
MENPTRIRWFSSPSILRRIKAGTPVPTSAKRHLISLILFVNIVYTLWRVVLYLFGYQQNRYGPWGMKGSAEMQGIPVIQGSKSTPIIFILIENTTSYHSGTALALKSDISHSRKKR